MSSFRCPYCSIVMPITHATYADQYPAFNSNYGYNHGEYYESTILISFFKCPSCEKYTVFAEGKGTSVKNINTIMQPNSLAKQFPDYIPEAIRNDYEEACAIVNLSPKASATLSRRCLQGMIRDFWEIKESNLAKAIEKLEGNIPATQWKVIDGVRRIGNIGAHMEKDINLIVDIEPNEAQKLIKLIEHLLEQWYINRHEQEQLYADIIGIDESKQSDRKKTE
ncbi:MAG: DUF4145 domain-containing protein [Lachnospiraceae bacterium]|nr:DUF4145 domain-containing protein [Lachnospiraceae bacterium]